MDETFLQRCMIAASAAWLVVAAASCTSSNPHVTMGGGDVTLITNARIYTVDAKQPWADAMAFDGNGVIIAVGTASQVRSRLGREQHSLPNIQAAIRAYTLSAAYLMRQEDRTGSIELGKLADLIVVNKNILEVATSQISSTKVLLTLLGGTEVYRAPGF